MTADQKYTTIEQSKRLKELGLNVKSEWVYLGEDGDRCHRDWLPVSGYDSILPRYDVPELLGMLPGGCYLKAHEAGGYVVSNNNGLCTFSTWAIDALAKAIIEGIQDEVLGFDVNEINERGK